MEKIIDGYGGAYSVTDTGNVYSQKWGNRLKMNPNRDGGGYPMVHLYNKCVQKTMKVHQLVAIAFIHNPSPETKIQINHKNGIKTDNRVENLEWVTPKENMAHAKNTGLLKTQEGRPGVKNAAAKLTNKHVLKIRKLYATGEMLQREIGAKFGMTQTQISNIVSRKCWKHL